MKKIYYIFVAFLMLISASGCKKYLDINKDPNNPLDVQEALILTPVQLYTTTNILGGFPASVAAYWTQHPTAFSLTFSRDYIKPSATAVNIDLCTCMVGKIELYIQLC